MREELRYDVRWREMRVDMTVLEDMFLAARSYNLKFWLEDQARDGEKFKEGYLPGQHFEEFLRCYVEVLLEGTSTKEEAG